MAITCGRPLPTQQEGPVNEIDVQAIVPAACHVSVKCNAMTSSTGQEEVIMLQRRCGNNRGAGRAPCKKR
jgi:hypothetical protein